MPWQGNTELVLTHPWDGSLRLGLDEGPQKMKETFKKCLDCLKGVRKLRDVENSSSGYAPYKVPGDTPLCKAVTNTVVRVPVVFMRPSMVALHCSWQ